MNINNLIKINKSRLKEKTEIENIDNIIGKYNFNDLNNYLIKDSYSFYYIKNIFNEEFANYLRKIIWINKEKTIKLPFSWRKVQNWGGIVELNEIKDKEELPYFMKKIIENYLPKIDLELNHCLVNIYSENTGIMAHKDGPRYYPFVFVISIGSHCIFNILEENETKERKIKFKYLIEPNSLIIFRDDIYNKFLHSINDNKTDLIEIILNKDDLEVKDSNINNLKQTSLFQNIYSKNLEEIKNNCEKFKYIYEIIEQDLTIIILITLIRKERISLTFRNVN